MFCLVSLRLDCWSYASCYIKLLHEAAAVEAAAVEAAAVDAAQCSSVGPDGRTTELQSFIVYRANHHTLITQRFLHD